MPPVVRTLNYLQKHEKPRDRFEARVTPNYLYDYWNMLSQVQNGLPPELLFPRDIRAAHDNAALRVKEKTDENINSGIAAFAASLDWLSFSDEETGLFIRVCKTQEELIKEGKFLNHCVGTYIYADPPWAYKQQGGAKGRGTAKAHYDTMETAEICSLPVKEIATEDALLFMWATFPNIKDALEVMEGHGALNTKPPPLYG